jgi:hypothetical protein
MQPMMQKSPKKAITHQGRPLFDAEIAQKGDYASGQTVIRCRNRPKRRLRIRADRYSMQKSPKKAITHQGRPLFDAEIAIIV